MDTNLGKFVQDVVCVRKPKIKSNRHIAKLDRLRRIREEK